MSNEIIILTFIITGLLDIVLRIISVNYYNLPSIIQNNFPFLQYLIPYFKHHTNISAALIAGFIGAITQIIILNIVPIQYILDEPPNYVNIVYFSVVTFLVSGIIGFPLKMSKLFPYLNDTYYKNLGPIRGFYHDGISGLIVQFILFIYIKNKTWMR